MLNKSYWSFDSIPPHHENTDGNLCIVILENGEVQLARYMHDYYPEDGVDRKYWSGFYVGCDGKLYETYEITEKVKMWTYHPAVEVFDE